MCVYNYRAVQEDFEDEMQQNATVTAIVEASCDAGRLYYSYIVSFTALLDAHGMTFPQLESMPCGLQPDTA